MKAAGAGIVDVLLHVADAGPHEIAGRLAATRTVAAVTASIAPVVDARWRTHGSPRPSSVHLGVGLLPAGFMPTAVDEQLAALAAVLDEYPVCVLSEIGLDRRKVMPPDDVQDRVFRQALRLAHHHGLPVVIHAVKAHGRLLAVLDDEGVPAGSIVHGWTGAPEAMEDLLERGLTLSFGPRILSGTAKRVQLSAAAVPADRFVVESDHPAWPLEASWAVVEHLATLRGTTAAAIEASAAANARRALRLPGPPDEP